MKSPLVSIIIPVYNVEAYLKQCVDSVINQTYRHLQIWLVDDGSTDTSGIICDAYKEIDSRVRVIHKKNGGLSSARNAALDEMNGDFVYFLDSDDFISRDLVETYMDLINSYEVDIVMGTSYEFYGNMDSNADQVNYKSKPEFYGKVESLKMMFMDEKLYHGAAGPMFKSTLFDNIRFPVGMLYEDYAIMYYVVAQSRGVLFIDDKRYYYRMRPGSIMNSKVTDKDMVLLDIADNIESDMVRLYPELEIPAIRKKIVVSLKLYSRILDVGFYSFEKEQKKIHEIVSVYEQKYLKSDAVKRKDRIKISAFKMGKLPFFFIYKISDYIQLAKKSLAK